MSNLPDVPKSDPATYGFLTAIKLAIIKLFEELAGVKSVSAPTSFLHTAITDFDEATQDTIASCLAAGLNVQITYNDAGNVITIAAVHNHPHTEITDFVTSVEALIGSSLVAGSNITISYDPITGQTTLSSAGTGGTGGPITHVDVSDWTEAVQDTVAATLVAGSGVTVTYNDAGNTIVIAATGGGGSGSSDVVEAEANGMVANSVGAATANTSALNALIASLFASGGGTIRFDSHGEWYINGPITLKSGVNFDMGGGQFSWAGGSSGNIFQSLSTDVLIGLDTEIVVHEGFSFSGRVFDFHSVQNCTMYLEGRGQNQASTFFNFVADSTSGAFAGGGLNSAFNHITCFHRGQCGYFMLMQGVPVGSSAQVVTLNTFHDCQANNAYAMGFRIEEWADSNTFSGNTYAGISGPGGIGFIVNQANSGTPSVYNTHIQHLAIDTFGSGLGRYGVVLNTSKQMYCSAFYQDPPAENGSFTGNNCLSYYWFTAPSGANSIFIHQKNVGQGL